MTTDDLLNPDRVDDLIRVRSEPSPWSARRRGDDRVFRGRLLPGAAVLPARRVPEPRCGVTIGLASRPIVLRSVGFAHQISAQVPWIVLADSEWRITVTEPTDLRLVHTRDLTSSLVESTVRSTRPSRFHGRDAKIVRAAMRSATPVWVDAAMQQVKDLAVTPDPAWRLISSRQALGTIDPDESDAFVLMMTWALEQRDTGEDPRFAVVAQFIRSRLADPGLNTQLISDQLQVSRRTLQSIFEEEGGVAGYIRRLRLAAVLQLITRDREQMPDLDGVADLTGLGSRRTLERAMRQIYGLTPLQARAQILAGHLLREVTLNELEASA